VGGYSVRYLRPTATITPKYDAAHTGSTLSLGAVLDVSKAGRHVTTLEPSEGFYASPDPSQGSVGSLIGGEPVSHVAINPGITRDIWTAIKPNIEAPNIARIIKAGNEKLPPEVGLVGIGYMAREYLKHPPQAQFKFEVSPLVMWIWIGGLIVLGGGLVAIWPAPATVRGRFRLGARVARGLSRS
jgi:cytochrome c-type biogenesis protein CcmF